MQYTKRCIKRLKQHEIERPPNIYVKKVATNPLKIVQRLLKFHIEES